MGERGGITGLAHGHEMSAGAAGIGKFGFRVGQRENADRSATAAARQGGQGVERGFGAAELMTSARKVAGPTFSLRISRSQLRR